VQATQFELSVALLYLPVVQTVHPEPPTPLGHLLPPPGLQLLTKNQNDQSKAYQTTQNLLPIAHRAPIVEVLASETR
jgi:hypothetical protein